MKRADEVEARAEMRTRQRNRGRERERERERERWGERQREIGREAGREKNSTLTRARRAKVRRHIEIHVGGIDTIFRRSRSRRWWCHWWSAAVDHSDTNHSGIHSQ